MKKLFLILTTLTLLTACDEDRAERVASCLEATEPWLINVCELTGGVMPETCAESVGTRPIESVDIQMYLPRVEGAPYCLLIDRLCTHTLVNDETGEFPNIMSITCEDNGVE